jgi:hypothetical protein
MAASFIPYPDTDNPDFNRAIAAKKEFAHHFSEASRKASTTTSCDTPTKFSLTPNQKVVKGFVSPQTPYNGVLLFHGTGTGKTCSAISIAEQFDDIFQKKHLVLVSGNLKDNFKKEIFDAAKIAARPDGSLDLDYIPSCTGTKYIKGIPDRYRINKETLENKVKRIVNERWQLMAYGEFYNEYMKVEESINKITPTKALQKRRLDQALADIYSDRVIVIDEVHTLRISGESTKKRVPPKVEHILRVARNVKLVLLTATPMYNDAVEIVYLLSLLLLNDKRITTPLSPSLFFEGGKLTAKGKKLLEQYSRGYVSYVSANDPLTFPARLSPLINNDPFILRKDDMPTVDIFNKALPHESTTSLLSHNLVKSYFGEKQVQVYNQVRGSILSNYNSNNNNADDDNDNEDDDNAGISKQAIVTALEVSNVAFPSSPAYGLEGFNSCFIKTSSRSSKDIASWAYQPSIQRKHGQFLDATNLEQHASKMKRIIDYILSSEGIVYVYTNYVYNGALPLAFALEHRGFRKYGGIQLLKDAKSSNEARGLNYVVLSANDEISPNNLKEIGLAKSAENVDGSLIKVIIGTSVATEGIDFKAIREVHIMEPWYNFNKLEQIFGRAVRHCSHARLPKEKRNVTIYKHVNLQRESNKKEESVDLRVYRIADVKQKAIDEVEAILKESSFDCLLTPDKTDLVVKDMKTSQNRLVDKYVVKAPKTQCSTKTQPSRMGTDTSTFHKQFIDDEIDQAKIAIANLFKRGHIFDFGSVVEKCQFSEEVIAYALNDMIQNKDRILDSTGNVGIIDYKSDKYLFQPLGKQFERLTVEQRAPDAWDQFNLGRMKVDLKHLSKVVVSQQKTQAETEGNSKPTDKDKMGKGKGKDKDKMKKNAASSSPMPHRAWHEIVTHIESMVVKLSKLFPNANVALGYKSQIYDYAIDRLDVEQLLLLVESLETLPSNIKSSIYRMGQLYEDNDKLFIATVDSDRKDAKYFVMKEGKMKPCGVRDTNRVLELETERRKNILITLNIKSLRDAVGFITPESLSHKFKLIRADAPKATGTVCASNSEMKKHMLEGMIKDVNPEVLVSTKKVTKEDLCNLFEIVLRKHNPSRMLRPYSFYLVPKKNEST